jgi:predicted deacylase
MSVNSRVRVGLILLLVAGARGFAAEREDPAPFVLGGLKARPGEVVSGYLDVLDTEGQGARIPVTVINGASRGKVVAFVAGVHGYEYPPILALYRLKGMVDPSMLKGTIVLVHIANPPSFRKRTIYYGPVDGKNLNGVFPGDAKGTLSQRIAYILTKEVIGASDVVVDMHCGDGNEALIPYTYWMIGPDKALNEVSRGLALAFGIPVIIIDDMRTQDPADSKYFGNTAILRGKAAITTEAGALGGTDEASVLMNVGGALNVLRHLGMIPGTPEPPPVPVWIDRYEVVESPQDGLFYPCVETGRYVVQGQMIGRVTDDLGTVKAEMKAPSSGIVLYIVGTPPAVKGEPLHELGRIKEDR